MKLKQGNFRPQRKWSYWAPSVLKIVDAETVCNVRRQHSNQVLTKVWDPPGSECAACSYTTDSRGPNAEGPKFLWVSVALSDRSVRVSVVVGIRQEKSLFLPTKGASISVPETHELVKLSQLIDWISLIQIARICRERSKIGLRSTRPKVNYFCLDMGKFSP